MVSLWIFDTIVESNRGYRANLLSKKKNRKQSIYNMDGEEDEQPIVVVKNLQKTYGEGVYALRGVSMELKKG